MVSRAKVREWNGFNKKQKKLAKEALRNEAKLARFRKKQEKDEIIVINGRLQWKIPR